MVPTQSDVIVIALPDDAPSIDSEIVRFALAEVSSRLESVAVALWSSDRQRLEHAEPKIQSARRVVVVPFALSRPSLAELRAFLWFAGGSSSTSIYQAEPPTLSELAAWIRSSAFGTNAATGVELVPSVDADNATLDRLAAIAYRTGRFGCCWIRGDRNRARETGATDTTCSLAFTHTAYTIEGESVQGAIIQCGDQTHRWKWISSEALATWIIGRYLQALKSHPISFPANSEDEPLWHCLKKLADIQHAMLPGEYSGNLDSVSPTSMGSACLVYDADGKVPWDAIWTSFCDLAMAGGPPHRGTLLVNVPIHEIEQERNEYDKVVSELRRGIGLASGLATCESATLGWVGVCCHDERMAAWMLRAIVVENILVRREGAVLYLPAGPQFRIDKEIKNVITAVAKTTHYWFAHLKTRQPPKPL